MRKVVERLSSEVNVNMFLVLCEVCMLWYGVVVVCLCNGYVVYLLFVCLLVNGLVVVTRTVCIVCQWCYKLDASRV